MEFKSHEGDHKEKLLKYNKIWKNKVNLIRIKNVSRNRVERLLEVDAYTNPTLVPKGESPLAEKYF